MIEEKENNKRYRRIKCIECNSGQVYYKIKEDLWQCRNCGILFKFDRKKIGHLQTEETKKLLSENHKNELNGNWSGDNVGLSGIHQWIRSRKEKPEFCEKCGKNKPYDLANISGEYKRDIRDFAYLCRSCHMKEDGRLENNLKQFNTKYGKTKRSKKEESID